MGKAPERNLTPKGERELIEEARRLADLGVSAAAVLRRVREEHEAPPAPELEDRAQAIIQALAWLSTPEAKTSDRPPELTPLSMREDRAVRAAIDATTAGVEASLVLDLEVDVEDVLRSRADRRAGRLAEIAEVPMLELLNGDRLALFSYRVRSRFLDWLLDCSPSDWKKALKVFRKQRWNPRGQMGAYVVDAVNRHRWAGASENEAVRRVAEEGLEGERLPDGSLGLEGFASTGPMTLGRVRSLLVAGHRQLRLPRKLTPHKRPGRSKPKTP